MLLPAVDPVYGLHSAGIRNGQANLHAKKRNLRGAKVSQREKTLGTTLHPIKNLVPELILRKQSISIAGQILFYILTMEIKRAEVIRPGGPKETGLVAIHNQ
jgi:hypothetical protein